MPTLLDIYDVTHGQAVNIFSELTPGVACSAAERAKHPPNGGCSTGEVISIDLSSAYSRQLGVSVGGDAGAKPTVKRTFLIPNANMSSLTVNDEIDASQNPGLNVTWGMHTRATVTLSADRGASALLRGSGSQKLSMTFKAEPSDACGAWQSAAVVLPTKPVPRFDLEGAKKVWLVCTPSLSRLQVTLSDEI